MTIALIISIVLNVLLLWLVAWQKFKASVATQAISDLLARVAKLEETVKKPPERIFVPQPWTKEN